MLGGLGLGSIYLGLDASWAWTWTHSLLRLELEPICFRILWALGEVGFICLVGLNLDLFTWAWTRVGLELGLIHLLDLSLSLYVY